MSAPCDGLLAGPDGRLRCYWHGGYADYIAYHDAEWGRPMADDTRLFEKLCLEGFQAGLSWLTILRKRKAFRRAFAGFDVERVARFSDDDVERLLADAAIVRHRGKIEAAIANARATAELIDEAGSFARFLWSFEPAPLSAPMDKAALVARAIRPEAAAASKALKRRGFRFVGPTTMTALFQAAGIVNDHLADCVLREDVEAERTAFTRP